jgi:hypothetical protein
MVADLDGPRSTLLLGGQPQVDKEAHRPFVVADEVAHQDIGQIIVEVSHAMFINTIATCT